MPVAPAEQPVASPTAAGVKDAAPAAPQADVPAGSGGLQQGDKSARIDRVRTARRAVHEMARGATEAPSEPAILERRLGPVVAAVGSVEDRARLAIACWAFASPIDAGDEPYDAYFEAAFWASVETIATDSAAGAQERDMALAEIESACDPDGAYSLRCAELEARAARLAGEEKVPRRDGAGTRTEEAARREAGRAPGNGETGRGN